MDATYVVLDRFQVGARDPFLVTLDCLVVRVHLARLHLWPREDARLRWDARTGCVLLSGPGASVGLRDRAESALLDAGSWPVEVQR